MISVMKRVVLISLSVVFCCAFVTKDDYRQLNQKNFQRGELLSYKFHYGFVNAGVCDIEVLPQLYRVNNRICYKMNINGRTTGSTDFFFHVRNQYGSYIDTAAMIPQKSYRLIQEGKYKLTEVCEYDHNANLVKKNKNGKEDFSYKTPDNVQDIVSSYYYLRTFDFDKIQVGEMITLTSFLEDTTLNFSMQYLGKEVIKTDVGKINAIILSPMMPKNKLFKGKNPIKAWFSDDENKIPLKAEAEMVVGSVDMDIVSYKGLRNPLNIIK
jgi:hypothetical protein